MLVNLAIATLTLGVSRVLGAAVSINQAPDVSECDYDAIVVGGGPSGLSALSGLARVRRNVLLIDSGVYRNGPTRHLHDLIGLDGLAPAYYRWLAREQLSQYDTVQMTNGTVTKIEPQANNTFFRVTTDTTQLTARKIVLATGLRDILPATPGIGENWGKGIYWCPWCDGKEHADQGLGLLANFSAVPRLVREMATLNQDVVAFVNGTDVPEMRAAAGDDFPGWETYLELRKIKIYNETIESIERLATAAAGDPSLATYPEYDLFRVHLAGGEVVERAAFFAKFNDELASTVGPDMGVTLEEGRLTANYAKGLLTNIPGVYAVGDANTDGATNIPHALFSGKRAAIYLHVQLERETASAQIEAYKQGRDVVEEEDVRSLWERMNGEPGDVLYAGEYRE
ncbi:unnamed protein product [Clonostachys rosea]|uniref:FAD/NAD(P)-binding domain-containing protein n=1 Tax=Bionectria ochroleuca TaxID=29856 RepID=A0ABY6ULV1_BIOOC|nr:unnamed protein product [Clonostachys rosea]